jgi:hypothetical protein
MPNAAKRKPAPRRRPAAPATAGTTSVEGVLAALREEVAALRQVVAANTDAMSAPAGLVTRLGESADLLARSAAELPRAEDFEPLADHLYELAQSAPRLVESLEAVRAAVGPLDMAARSLGEVAETLAATHHGWAESLLRLPRAEDYEPLTEPLREFARVSPLLAETLSSVVKAVTPLPGMVEEVLGAARTGRPGREASRGKGGDTLRGPLEEAADQMAAARATIRESLATLPRDPAYGKAATQLRELATVSPSLMEWMRQLPEISLPLGEAFASLDRAAKVLEIAERAARSALED